MIAKLSGTVDEIALASLIIDVSGVGYLVHTTGGTLAQVRTDQPVTLFTHHVVRETAADLYGFLSKTELDFFELLLTVSGIGPKSALGILNTASIDTIREGVQTGDAAHLSKVSGIGRKNAEKIVLELKDKIGALEYVAGKPTSGSGDAIEALTALGYSLHEARDAIKHVDKDLTTEEMVKHALKHLL
jgi:holliday junction DNA helicase RuvA